MKQVFRERERDETERDETETRQRDTRQRDTETQRQRQTETDRQRQTERQSECLWNMWSIIQAYYIRNISVSSSCLVK